MTFVLVAAFLIPFVFSLLFTRVMTHLAPRIGLMDYPAARKVHAKVTPMGGGVAIYLSLVFSLLGVIGSAALIEKMPTIAALFPEVARVHARGVLASTSLLGLILLAATIQMLLGLADDWRRSGLSYQFRLLVEVGLVVLLVTQGVKLSVFTDNLWITAPLTVLWIVGLTNALNFLDNMDGLSAGVAACASVLFAAQALLVGDLFVAGCFVLLLGALAGFLRYNFSPAKIFMGDAGSNFLGFWLGVLTVVGTFNTSDYSHVTILAPLCILAVPMYDSMTVIGLRLAQGRSPFQPDKQHFSHRLVDLGFRPQNAVLLIYLVTLTTGLGGLLLFFVTPAASVLILLQVGCTLGVIGLLEAVAARRRTMGSQPGVHAAAEGTAPPSRALAEVPP